MRQTRYASAAAGASTTVTRCSARSCINRTITRFDSDRSRSIPASICTVWTFNTSTPRRAGASRSGILSMIQSGGGPGLAAFLPPGTTDLDTRQDAAYSYADIALTSRFTFTGRRAADSVKGPFTDLAKIDPKLGVTWMAYDALTLRAAAFKTVTYNLSSSKQNAQPRLEPVQVAGFNQFLFTSNGDTATVYGLGVDGRLSSTMFAGFELEKRELETQVVDAATHSGDLDPQTLAGEERALLFLLDAATNRQLQRTLRGRRFRRAQPIAALLLQGDEAALFTPRGEVLRQIRLQRGPARLAFPSTRRVHVRRLGSWNRDRTRSGRPMRCSAIACRSAAACYP